MCNDYEQHVRWAEYRKVMQGLDLGIPSHQSELDLPQADDIRISDTGPVMRASGNGIELVPMTFAFPPGRLAVHQSSTFDPRAGTLPTAIVGSCLRPPSLNLPARSTQRRSTDSHSRDHRSRQLLACGERRRATIRQRSRC
jgi:hypothetical protein